MPKHGALSRLLLTILVLAVASCSPGPGGASGTAGTSTGGANGVRFEISVPAAAEPAPIDGRVLLLVSSREEPEPRFQALRSLDTPQIFGVDVDGLAPGEAAVIDASTRGFPLESAAEIPAGDYFVQAVLNVYTTFERADGHTIKAHMDQWEGQHWNRSPGNLFSEVQRLRIDPASDDPIAISLSERIPPIDPPEDTDYVKHIKFRSDILSDWWGHDIDLGAVVVLPEGFDEHPEARYPVVYWHGHFPSTFRGFQEEPPGPELSGRARAAAESRYRLFQEWQSGRLGRFLIVFMQHPTPFYDDSYAVNSANNGPYGDAMTQELMPRVEEQFRALGEPWARTLSGGSTGGWESLAWQVFYPDMFNGTWTFCPDPVDFRYFQLVDIYEDDNAFYPNSEWKTSPVRPWQRSTDDQVRFNQKDASHLEAVLGTRGRSGDQMDIFMSVFGPVGDDGYPRLLYDKWTGEIDKEIAEYWRNYDLRYVLENNWEEIGPQLVGKIHIYMGDKDTYFLDGATELMEDFLESTEDPYYDGSFTWGPGQPHCFSGFPDFPGQTSYERVLPLMLERILSTAPPEADVTSWRY